MGPGERLSEQNTCCVSMRTLSVNPGTHVKPKRLAHVCNPSAEAYRNRDLLVR